MARDFAQLKDIRRAMVRFYCPDCHRFAQFRTAGLIERFGLDQEMPGLLTKLKPCDRVLFKIGTAPCQLRYWDRMTPERRREALAKGGLPEGWTAD